MGKEKRVFSYSYFFVIGRIISGAIANETSVNTILKSQD